MAQLGNTYTGKLADIPNYLTRNHLYFAYDTKELYTFNDDKTPHLLASGAIQEEDPIFTASPAFTISDLDIERWNETHQTIITGISYHDLLDLPEIPEARTDKEIQDIIKQFVVEGDNISIIYDEELDVLRIHNNQEVQGNMNIVVTIDSTSLTTQDEEGIEEFINNLNPPLMIEAHHNIFIKVDLPENMSTIFDNEFNFNLS